jgi:hypothetical protein
MMQNAANLGDLQRFCCQDSISKIPQYKVCACRVRKADGPPDYEGKLEPQQ